MYKIIIYAYNDNDDGDVFHTRRYGDLWPKMRNDSQWMDGQPTALNDVNVQQNF